MAFEVIHDAAKDVAALIDPELGRALGPIATGEQAVDLLDKFAAAHGVDPATIPTPELETRWKEFVTALTEPVAEADGEKVSAGDVVASGGGTPHAGGPPAAPEPSPIEPAAASGEASGSGEAPAGEASPVEPSGDKPEPQKETPVTTPQPDHIVCPECEGWREVVKEGTTVQCPTCKGEGEVGPQGAPESTGAGA